MKTEALTFLKNRLNNKLFLSKNEAEELREYLSLEIREFLFELLEVIKERAVMPLSQFLVASIAIARSGNLYFGASQDFCHTTTSQCVHAEQSAIYNAFLHEESEITTIVVNAAPCGFCRQFLYEVANRKDLEIIFPNHDKMQLTELLPFAFGPNDLGKEGGMLTSQKVLLKLKHNNGDPLIKAALKAASCSYSPYWNDYSGVAIQTSDGNLFKGSYLENVAQNPGLPPMQAALIHLNLSGYSYLDIERIVLIELENPKISQLNHAQDLLKAIDVNITIESIKATNNT